MLQQQHQIEPSNERQIQTALQALKQDATLSLRRAAAIYKVTHTTLSRRRAGPDLLSVSSVSPESSGLTELTS